MVVAPAFFHVKERSGGSRSRFFPRKRSIFSLPVLNFDDAWPVQSVLARMLIRGSDGLVYSIARLRHNLNLAYGYRVAQGPPLLS